MPPGTSPVNTGRRRSAAGGAAKRQMQLGVGVRWFLRSQQFEEFLDRQSGLFDDGMEYRAFEGLCVIGNDDEEGWFFGMNKLVMAPLDSVA